MKKIMALLLCALMLLGMTAVAEEASDTALVSSFKNIVIESTSNGQTSTMNLEGLEIYLSLDTADGLALVAQAFDGNDCLAMAVLKLVGTQLRLGVDGMDKTYVVDIPQLNGQDTDGLAEVLRPILPKLIDVQLPMINVVSLPKLDLAPIVGMFGSQEADGTTTFTIPAELIDGLLDQVIQTAKASGESVPGLAQALEMIEQLRASGTSLSVSGAVTDSADRQTVNTSIFLVNNGTVAEAPLLTLNLTSAQDEITLTVDVPGNGQTMTVASLQIQTDASENSFYSTLDIGGAMQFNLAAFQEDGMQKAALTVEGNMDASFAVTLAYGKDGDSDVMDLTFAAGEDTAFEITTHSAMVSETELAGTCSIMAAMPDAGFNLSCDIGEFLGSLDLGDFAMPEATAPMEALNGEEASAAMQTALQPLIDYFSRIAMNTAA